jgi:hypothetical protein
MSERISEIGGKLVAIGVLAAAAYLLFKVVLGFVSFAVWMLVGVLAIVAILWALNRVL